MASSVSEVSGIGRSSEGISSGQLSRSGEAIAEWRSSEQVENGTPSTSPPYWDTDDDDDCGPKPSELYVKYTWKIDKFSEINQRELRSNPFDVGGYKWYILIYPQGCDVCNHLSLFLCVANHDKLLPGWSHFAQFTIAVVNKDPKKSKYSDTLHRFWKKEHDWGWKKFMELSKVSDGFIDADTLIIKAQVQVIRERADRPFRCLDCQYRRELVRVYLTNVEQICRRFVEERRGKLEKLIEDKARWSSFCAFWRGVDQNAGRRMSREKTDAILKVVLKHFFIEKEVTSTLVMDSLYSGLKALEGRTKGKKGGTKLLDAEETPVPIVCVEKDMFVLVDDVLLLLERAAMEPLPPKDEKGPQNRTKDGGCGEDFNKDSVERDERRLMELGRRTIEIFVLAHIFSSKIEVAYHEAVALKRQEELIREEEAAWLAETEQKAKRGVVEKEKKSKKKQGKQKRNNRKGKDKGKDEMPGVAVQDKLQQEDLSDETKDSLTDQAETLLEKPDKLEDVSDASDSVECVLDILQPDSEDRDASPVSWDTDASEVQPPTEASSNGISVLSSVQNGMRERQSPSVIDDSSSTCSTDSVPSVVTNGLYNRNSIRNQKSQKSPSSFWERSERGKVTCDATSWANETQSQPSEPLKEVGQPNDVSGSCKTAESESESESVVLSLQDRIKWLERHVVKKENEVFSLQRELSIKDRADTERSSTNGKTVAMPTSPRSSPPKKLPSAVQLRSELKINPATNPVLVGKQFSIVPPQTDKAALLINSAENAVSFKPDTHEAETSKPTEKLLAPQIPVMSRPLNARPIPAPRLTAPVVSVVQTTPSLAHSMSAAGHLGPELSAATHSYVPQSYRGAIMSNPVAASTVALTQAHSPSLAASPSQSYSQPLTLVSTPMFLPQSSERMNLNTIRPSFPFGMANHEASQNGFQWVECHQPDTSRSIHSDHSDLSSPFNDLQNYDFYKPVQSRSLNHFPTDFPACSSGHQSQGIVADEFPHLDIINDLLVQSRSLNHFPTDFPACLSGRQSQGIVADEFRHLDVISDLVVQSRPVNYFPTEFPACSSGRQSQGIVADEFPHLDIINDLLDDEHGIGKAAKASSGFKSFSNGPHHLNRQFTFPGDIGFSSDTDLSTGSCRFERTRSYLDDGFQRGYGSSGGYFDSMRDVITQPNQGPCVNGQIGELIPNQWQMAASDLSSLSLRHSEGDSSAYHIPEYSNLACAVNGYTVFQPPNGH